MTHPQQPEREIEREAIVRWLDQWAAVPSTSGNKDYDAGWTMACFNAAREIERGDHHQHTDRG